MALSLVCKTTLFDTIGRSTHHGRVYYMYTQQHHFVSKVQSRALLIPWLTRVNAYSFRIHHNLKKCAENLHKLGYQHRVRHRFVSAFSPFCKPKFVRRLCWIPGLATIKKWREKRKEATLSHGDILSNIPKEILATEKPRKKQRNIIARLLGYLFEAIHYAFRFWRIIFTFGPLLSIYPVICWNQRLKYLYWRVLLYVLETTGPTFIKLGQWAGTRRELFSPEFCDLFSRLHICTRTHSWYVTKKKLRKAFGKRWREVLVKVHKRPIGSGCIAQVHKAYMNADMIPDESLVDEILEEESDEPEIDFADGLEIIGLGGIPDELEDLADDLEAARGTQSQRAPSSATPSLSPSAEDDSTTTPLDVISQAGKDTTVLPTIGPSDDGVTLVPVAVKVLHPGVYRAVRRDLWILSRLVWLTEKLVPGAKWLSLQECMEEFSDVLVRQIDLRMEAECLEQFNDNFQEHPNIRFPKPVWPYCKRSVLVETFEEGESLANFLLDQQDNGEDSDRDNLKEKLAAFGVDALLQMVFVDNFVHGDLHPGNILVQNAKDYVPQEENKLMLVDVGDTVIVNVKPTECPVRLVMLDVGITASLSEEDLANFKAVFTAVVVGEGKKVAELMLRHARYSECKDVEGFKNDLGEIVNRARQDTVTLGTMQVSKLLSDVFSTLSRHKVKMESSFASILLAIFVLEGLGRSLDPEMDILERAKPVLLG